LSASHRPEKGWPRKGKGRGKKGGIINHFKETTEENDTLIATQKGQGRPKGSGRHEKEKKERNFLKDSVWVKSDQGR